MLPMEQIMPLGWQQQHCIESGVPVECQIRRTAAISPAMCKLDAACQGYLLHL
eukprot:CAMPEP_0172740350 /NCGR_PEP_ID=MMETSP1074-20121228/124686_1 /TAXON_ID=2916 /ORGANISM="Ceratium fusus, Strain PA161109" /LENGTH=52 /DNA_ID=CAMNT_0013570435 /DNA_START=96 /DNA_END=251 /DNA_ORIENTATION=+